MPLPITQLDQLPKISGLYKVMNADGKVIYIGQSQDIHNRWKRGHHRLADIVCECGTAACIDWVEIPKWLLNRAEHTAIHFYQPELNSRRPPVV